MKILSNHKKKAHHTVVLFVAYHLAVNPLLRYIEEEPLEIKLFIVIFIELHFPGIQV